MLAVCLRLPEGTTEWSEPRTEYDYMRMARVTEGLELLTQGQVGHAIFAVPDIVARSKSWTRLRAETSGWRPQAEFLYLPWVEGCFWTL